MVYYTRLKALWDQLACLKSLLICNCDIRQEIIQNDQENKVSEFLMGLNDTFDPIRNQILVMEPMPIVHRVYSMLVRVERQRSVGVQFSNPLLFHSELSLLVDLRKGDWILDTGASRHMCNDLSLFHSITTISTPISVLLLDGSTKLITQLGQITLNDKFTLHYVLFIPSFKYNLLSVSQLTVESNVKCIFTPSSCFIQDLKSGSHLAVGQLHHKLYILKPFSTTISCNFSIETWHHMLGHASLSTLQHLPFLKHLCNKSHSIKSCDACFKAKQSRLSFPHSDIQSTALFELIHIDIWGPCREETITNKPFFLTIVDDFSRGTWVFLMSHKSQTFKFLKNFILMIHTQFQRSAKIIRSDNGLEFISTQCQDFFFFSWHYSSNNLYLHSPTK